MMAVTRRDEAALEEIYRRHGGAVHALARRVTADDALAEDVTQAVFLRTWQRPERFDPERGALRSWLLADTHGRAVDLVRSSAARRRREANDNELAPAPPPDGVEQAVSRAVAADEIRVALSRLPEEERAAIVLAYFGGHTYRRVAELLDQPEGTVKSRIRAGLRRLRGMVASEVVES